MTGCGANDNATERAAGTSANTQGGSILPSSSTSVLLISLSPDAPDGDVLYAPSDSLDQMRDYPQIRSAVLEGLAAEPDPVLGYVGEQLLIDGPLPDDVRGGRSQDCMHLDVVYLDAIGDELVHVPAGTCGLVETEMVFEFGADGVEIADRRFIDDPPDPSPEGKVAIDRPATRGILPGASLGVALDPVPEADIAAHPAPLGWPPLRPFVCFDVTVHSGAAGADDQVVPAVAISQAGALVPVPEPTNQSQPRVITQDADSMVVWSFGPIDMDERQPDSITVTASQGEIVSWDVSARHC